MESILFQAIVYLAAAILIVPLAVRFGLGSVLGYLAAGIVIGPLLGLVGNEVTDLQHFAEFGVVLMLFVIGLELEPRALWSMRHKLIGLGGLQVVLTTGLVMLAAIGLGVAWQTGLVIGMMFAMSSTAIVLQTLNEKRLMETAGGRSIFAVLLTQDIAVVPMLALIPLLAVTAGLPEAHGTDAAEGASATATGILAFVEALPAWGFTLMTLAIVAAIILGGHFLTRPGFRFIHRAHLRELTTFFALLIVMGIAFGMMLVGLSPALGTFLAGVVLANSEFRHQLEADIEPFKGLLLGLFFVTVGAGINFDVFLAQPLGVLGMTLGMIAIKAAVLFGLARVFRLRGRDRWLFTFSLAQAGEFGFLIASFAVQQGAMPAPVSQTVLLVVGLSMLLTPLLFIGFDLVARKLAAAKGDIEPDVIDEQGSVIIAGIGRFGQVVNRLVRTAGVSTTVLDSDMATIELLRKFGVKGFLGDPTRPELLAAAGLDKARVLVVAVDDPVAAIRIVTYARRERPDLHIVARARDRVQVFELFSAGANDIVREMFDSSVRAGRYVLENSGFTEFEASEISRAFYHHDRSALRELAELWVPGLAIEKNAAYIARAQALNKSLESALMAKLDQGIDLPEPARTDDPPGVMP